MGYETRYSLKVNDGNNHLIEIFVEDSNANWALNMDGSTREECKWYDHEKELLNFSKKYPDIVFELSGEGEEFPDIWKKYFKAGKMQLCTAIITYLEYDESKLK